jgi:hypothetical protein
VSLNCTDPTAEAGPTAEVITTFWPTKDHPIGVTVSERTVVTGWLVTSVIVKGTDAEVEPAYPGSLAVNCAENEWLPATRKDVGYEAAPETTVTGSPIGDPLSRNCTEPGAAGRTLAFSEKVPPTT